MAVKALILVETAVGKVEEAGEALRRVEGVKSVDAITGPYDLAAMVEGADLGSLGTVVIRKIHALPHISRTTTCLVVRSF